MNTTPTPVNRRLEPSVHTSTIPVHTAPPQYAPVASIHAARRHEPDTIEVTQTQAAVYAGALLVTFMSAVTCGVAAFTLWLRIHG